jgi:hypothetical protein
MELIDWLGVARNALWIVGLSSALAIWSYIRWWAVSRGLKMRQALEMPLFQVPFSASLILFCASLAWSSARWWERGLWVVLGLAFTWQVISGWRFARRRGWDIPQATDAPGRPASEGHDPAPRPPASPS